MNYHSSTNDEITQDLVPALIKCFGIIFVGYVFGRFQILPNDGRKGLGIFVQNLALPVLVFNLVAKISFESVNWTFVASVFVAKTIIFVAVALISFILMNPIHIGKVGLYAILATQSNDFALGYPLLMSLYQSSHSNYSSWLYLTAPVQILLLNPVGFFMLEIYKQTQDDSCRKRNPLISILKGTVSNPIVAMTALGVVWNFSFNHKIPIPIAQMIDGISSAFPATALFLLGHSMAGRISTFKGYFALTPLLLTLAKNLILPIILQRIVVALSRGSDDRTTQDLSNLGFLYGAIPCAPASFVFACQYDLSKDVVASTVIFSTLWSAPMIFVSATMATLSLHGSENVAAYMESTIGYISSASLICCLWLLIMFAVGRRWRSATVYGVTAYLVFAQLVTSIGGVLCFFRNTDSNSILYAQYMLTCGGYFTTRIWAVPLAVLLFISQRRCVRFILGARYIMNIAGLLSTLGVAFMLAGSLLSYRTPTSTSSSNFQLGYAQVLLTSVVTVLCLIMIVVSLMLLHKFRMTVPSDHICETSEFVDETVQIIKTEDERNIAMNYGSVPSHKDNFSDSTEHNLPNTNSHGKVTDNESELGDTEYRDNDSAVKATCGINSRNADFCEISCDSPFSHNAELRSSQCSTELYQNVEDDSEDSILQHTILLVILSLSMLVTFSVCLWKLFLEATNGIFVELEFLDIALNYGQGIIYFLIFGFDATIIRPFSKLPQYIQCWNRIPSERNNLSS